MVLVVTGLLFMVMFCPSCKTGKLQKAQAQKWVLVDGQQQLLDIACYQCQACRVVAVTREQMAHIQTKSDVGKALAELVAENLPPPNVEPARIDPAVAPEEHVLFSVELDQKIEVTYADQAVQATDFQRFQELMDRVIAEQMLAEADRVNVAALLNRMRVKKGLDPL